MKLYKKIALSFLALATLVTGYLLYDIHFNYRFTEISPNKVYRSALIPSDKIENYIKEKNIKTVIDLRKGEVVDPLNPTLPSRLKEEQKAVHAIEGVNYVNIPSTQIPTQENLNDFYRILDDAKNYPVLIHCHHGTGRAVLYSAIYRVEYEGYTNENARKKTRFPVVFSNFDNGTPKGEWLKDYKPRSSKDLASSKVLHNSSGQ